MKNYNLSKQNMQKEISLYKKYIPDKGSRSPLHVFIGYKQRQY